MHKFLETYENDISPSCRIYRKVTSPYLKYMKLHENEVRQYVVYGDFVDVVYYFDQYIK